MSTVYTGPDRLQLDHRQLELAGAVRTVGRWGLLAGVIACLSNVLLVVMFATLADSAYAWTGGASDVTGMVSILAMIPVAAALLVLGLVPQAAQADLSYVSLLFISGWLLATGRAGRASGRLPQGVAGRALGWARPSWRGRYCSSHRCWCRTVRWCRRFSATPGCWRGPTGLAYPVWLIVLFGRLPGHIARSVH